MARTVPTEFLSSFGLSDKEAKAYLAILSLGSSTIKPISDQAGLKRTSLYNFIDRLVELGLVTRSQKRGRNYYQASSPGKLVELQKERLKTLEDTLPELMSIFNLSATKPRISYFEGPDEMKNIVREEPRCSREVLYIWTGREILDMIGGSAFMGEVDRQRIAAKVKVRTIRFREKDIRYPRSGHGPQYLRELRFAPAGLNLTMSLGIYDTGKVSFFSSRKEGFGILIESRELQVLMTYLWGLFWQRSTPAERGEG